MAELSSPSEGVLVMAFSHHPLQCVQNRLEWVGEVV